MKLSDLNQAKVWAKVVREQASNEGVKLATEDNWIVNLFKG